MAEGLPSVVGWGALIRRWWIGELGGLGRVLLVLAWPAAFLFRLAVAVRNAAYDRGLRHSVRAPIPVVSVGNLLVGGTGKTPVAGWFVGLLQVRGRRPALVTRGYGAEEVELHRRWNPEAPVVVAERRVNGVRQAAARGADVAVLDDGFQHRALARDLDVVLVPAEEPLRSRLLPVGPGREPATALRRADIVVVTRRGVPEETARDRAEEARLLAPRASVVRVRMEPSGWEGLDGETADPPEFGAAVLGVCGIARPGPFRLLLEERVGPRVEVLAFPDHHGYAAVDARRIAERARGRTVVTTEKDAVKLLPYRGELRDVRVLTLRVVAEEGAAELERALERTAAGGARGAAGAEGPG